MLIPNHLEVGLSVKALVLFIVLGPKRRQSLRQCQEHYSTINQLIQVNSSDQALETLSESDHSSVELLSLNHYPLFKQPLIGQPSIQLRSTSSFFILIIDFALPV